MVIAKRRNEGESVSARGRKSKKPIACLRKLAVCHIFEADAKLRRLILDALEVDSAALDSQRK